MVPDSDTSNFEIHINNFKDFDSVNYKLVLLHGSICLSNNVGSSIVNGSVICRSNNINVTWPVYNGYFKCLAQLIDGQNEVVLMYEKNSKKLFISCKVHETDRCVVPIYLIPKDCDGFFQAPEDVDNSENSAVARIGFVMQMIQCLFAEKLYEKDFPRKSFQLEMDLSSKAPPCRLFRSNLTVDKVLMMNEEELWEEVGRELMMSNLGSEKHKFVCFVSCTSWNGQKVLADPALGGGGLALLGSASLHTWPASLSEAVSALTNDKKLAPGLLDNSCFRLAFYYLHQD